MRTVWVSISGLSSITVFAYEGDIAPSLQLTYSGYENVKVMIDKDSKHGTHKILAPMFFPRLKFLVNTYEVHYTKNGKPEVETFEFQEVLLFESVDHL